MNIFQRFVKWISGGNMSDVIQPDNYSHKVEEGSPLGSFINQYTHHTVSGEQLALNAMNRQNIVDEPSLKVQGYQKAGLNPALMYGAGAGSSSVPAQQQQVSGAGIQDLVALMSLPQQLQQMRQNIELTKQEVEQRKLDNVFNQRTLDARVQSVDLANNLTGAQIEQIEANKGLILANLSKVIEETKNEKEKRMLIQAQTALENAKAKEIAAMMPYNQLLLLAQTENQQATACASWIAAAYQQKLIDAGYVESMCNQMYASAAQMYSGAELNKQNAGITKFKDSVYNGTFFDESPQITKGKTFIGRAINKHASLAPKAANAVFRICSGVCNAIAGPLSGLINAK